MTQPNGPREELDEIKRRLTPEAFRQLAEEARRQGRPITDLVKQFALDTIEEVFDGLDAEEESD